MELTKEHFEQYIEQYFDAKMASYPNKDDLAIAIAPLATKKDVRDAVEELARFVAETVANPMEERFQRMDEQFQRVEERFQQIDVRFQQIDVRFQQIDARFQQVEERFQQIDVRFQQIDVRFQEVSIRLERIEASGLVKLPTRVKKLEDDMGKIKNALYLG